MWLGRRCVNTGTTTIIPMPALLMAFTGQTGSWMDSLSGQVRGITGVIRPGSGIADIMAADSMGVRASATEVACTPTVMLAATRAVSTVRTRSTAEGDSVAEIASMVAAEASTAEAAASTVVAAEASTVADIDNRCLWF